MEKVLKFFDLMRIAAYVLHIKHQQITIVFYGNFRKITFICEKSCPGNAASVLLHLLYRVDKLKDCHDVECT